MYIYILLSALKLRDTPISPCIYTPPPTQFGKGTLKKALQPKRCAINSPGSRYSVCGFPPFYTVNQYVQQEAAHR